MISVAEALEHVGRWAESLAPQRVALSNSLGFYLAEAIVSSLDSPPFDKSMLDGYAVDADDPAESFRVLEQVIAGNLPSGAIAPGTTVHLMTGAPLPAGANAVAKHEDCRVAADGTVRLPPGGLQPGAGVMQRGASFAAGEIVLSAGKRISPIDMGMLAEVGRSSVLAAARPRVAVLATGNELVEVGVAPGPGQIVNSNGPMLLAWLEQLGAAATDLGIARDDPAGLEARMAAGLEHDVLLVSGGVSAGVMDLVPGVLERLGVRQVFHKIRMKPGKPLWFGVRVQDDRRTLVFGLPGNPVSTLASFVLFVKPALRALAGGGFVAEDIQLGVLAAEVSHRGPRPTYYPCVAKCVVGELNVEPLRWRGSSDLAALTRANALAVLPEGDYRLEAGRRVELVWLNR